MKYLSASDIPGKHLSTAFNAAIVAAHGNSSTAVNCLKSMIEFTRSEKFHQRAAARFALYPAGGTFPEVEVLYTPDTEKC